MRTLFLLLRHPQQSSRYKAAHKRVMKTGTLFVNDAKLGRGIVRVGVASHTSCKM